MSPTSRSDAFCESVALLDGKPKERCCFGTCRMYGPDSAWSWLVAFSNFLIHFLVVGLARMSGILYVNFMDAFGVDRKTASTPFCVQQACRNLFGPLAGIVGQKYGLRNMNIFGGTAVFLGATVLFFKLDMTYIIIFWGLLFGIGAACTTTLNQISIDQCFDRNRATAGGFAVSGGCVGAFLFPFVLESSIAHFELKGTFLLLGSLLLFTIPAAFMLVDPPWKQHQQTTESSYRGQNISRYGSFENKVIHDVCRPDPTKSANKELIPAATRNKIRVDFSILRENRDIVVQLLTNENSVTNGSPGDGGTYELVDKLEHIYSIVEGPDVVVPSAIPSTSRLSQDPEDPPRNEDSTVAIPDSGTKSGVSSSAKQLLTEKELLHVQSQLQKLYERDGSRVASNFHYDDQPRACKILTELRKLYETLTTEQEPGFDTIYNKAQYFNTRLSTNKPEVGGTTDAARRKEPFNHNNNSLRSHLWTALRLHRSPVFLLICLCRAVFMLTFVPVVTVVVDFALDQGLDRSLGKYAVAALSLGDLVGRLCLGWVTDRKYLSQPRYALVGMVLLGGCSALLPFLRSGPALLSAVLCYGALQGSLFVRHPMLVSQFVGSGEQSVGMGCINLLSGIVGFFLPAFIGYFRDDLGSYDEMFFINAIMCGTVGLLWGLEPFFPSPKAESPPLYRHL